MRTLLRVLTCVVVSLLAACSAEKARSSSGDGGTNNNGGGGNGGTGNMAGSIGFGGSVTVSSGSGCMNQCSSDFHAVVDCNGMLVEQCTGDEGCDSTTLTCENACDAAKSNKQSVGCEYYATDMDQYGPTYCFAAFVANTWNTPVHLTVTRQNVPLPVDSFTRIPNGSGPSLTYSAFDNTQGLLPGEVAILFLSGAPGPSPQCPVAGAIPSDAGISGTGISPSFRIQTDVPVVAYQINPYGGGSVAVTGASLLLPTSAWDTNYIAVNAYRYDIAGPSMNIIAMEDNTNVTILPVANVQGGGGLPSGPANQPLQFTMFAGYNAQFTQNEELTGSVIQSDKPIGFMAGQPCMRTPFGVAYCDHGEQMVPPIPALGSEYVGVMYRPRAGEPAIWRLIGAVDGTQLTWTPPVGGPAVINRGEIVEVQTGTPFVVSSQDTDHPFLLFTHMSGSQWNMLNDLAGWGDVDFVISVPTPQYMSAYVFFADPTYPETNLVVVRSKDAMGNFHDVELDCGGILQGWTAVGDYEWTRVDLITGNFQNVGNCSTGRHEINSTGRFGLWVWGWGSPITSTFTANVSYGYPGGMNVQPINQVIIPPTPR